VSDASGLRLGVGAQPGLLIGKLSLNDLDADARKAAIDEVKASIDFAAELDSPLVACLSGPDPGEEQREDAVDLLVDSLVQLCEHGQEMGGDEPIWISLEQFDHKYDKKCLVGPSEVAVRVAYRVRDKTPNFGLCVDLSHIPLLEESITDCITTLSDHLIHVHAGNCVMRDESHDAYGDMHPRFGHPDGENGVDELKTYIETLTYAGYFQADVPTEKPIFTFEVKPLEGETPDLVIASTKRTFLEAWSAL
jgi:sugar phosphate isomerase/epimerase